MPDVRSQILAAMEREARHITDPKAKQVFRRSVVQTGLVESNLSNPTGGDADSQGWRQERASLYPNPRDIAASMRRFREEFQQHYQPGEKSYEVAPQIQRPREDLRGKYKDRAREAEGILKSLGAPVSSSNSQSRADVAGSDSGDARRQILAQYLLGRDRPNNLLATVAAVRGLEQNPESVQAATPAPTKAPGSGDTRVAKRADAISRQKLPYQWGGGHGTTKPGTPLDCSGAVSKALGIDARVSGEFTKWGKPGRAPGGKGTTIYANEGHVLMEVDGRFWGTSKANPGGGAGWIPRAQISREYLAGFTARHE